MVAKTSIIILLMGKQPKKKVKQTQRKIEKAYTAKTPQTA